MTGPQPHRRKTAADTLFETILKAVNTTEHITTNNVERSKIIERNVRSWIKEQFVQAFTESSS